MTQTMKRQKKKIDFQIFPPKSNLYLFFRDFKKTNGGGLYKGLNKIKPQKVLGVGKIS